MINWDSIYLELEKTATNFSQANATFGRLNKNMNDSERELVLTEPFFKLYQYKLKSSNTKKSEPKHNILLVYSWINKADIVDFSSKCSLINSLNSNIDANIYLLEWQEVNLSTNNKPAKLIDYCFYFIDRALRQINNDNPYRKNHLIGICQGGVFSLCYASQKKAQQLASLSVLMTPVDNDPDLSILNKIAYKTPIKQFTNGMVPGIAIHNFFSLLAPNKQYLARMLTISNKKQMEEFTKIEHWLMDTPNMPLTLLQKYIVLFSKDNCLISSPFNLDSFNFDLSNIRVPVLNFIAKHDRLVVPRSSRALKDLIPKNNYYELSIDAGHLSIFTDKSILDKFITYFSEKILTKIT